MTFFKYILIVFGTAGLLFLAACGNGQKTATSDSSPVADSSSPSEQGSQSLKPATQTGEAHMALNVTTNPLPQGKNKLTLMLMDAQEKPVPAKNVQVAMTMTAKEMDAMGMKGMGEGSAKTQLKSAASPGHYEIETNVPFAGNWQLKVDAKDTQPPASAVFNLAVK